jgi:hypothetical protein
MKALAALLLLLAGLPTVALAGGDKKQPDLKYDMTELEKAFSLQFKSATVDGTKVKMLLAFTNTLTEPKYHQRYFSSPLYNPPAEGSSVMYCYCFDEDNVLLCKGMVVGIEGEISGRKDDAFRVIFDCPCLAKARKLDLRLAVMEKVEKKVQDEDKKK